MAEFGSFWVLVLKKKKARHETLISRIHTKDGKKETEEREVPIRRRGGAMARQARSAPAAGPEFKINRECGKGIR